MNLKTIKTAFDAVKLKPGQRQFFGVDCCCILSALYLKANPGAKHEASDVLMWANKIFPNSSTIIRCWDGRNNLEPEVVKARKHYFGA